MNDDFQAILKRSSNTLTVLKRSSPSSDTHS